MAQDIPSVELNNGIKMPQFGLGVYQAEAGEEVELAVKTALEAGYRHIDTAMIYRNEESVGKVIAESGIPRDELFITTKLWNDDQGYETSLAAIDASLKRLGLDYVDLYLMHWPVPSKGLFKETWRAMEQLYKDGKTLAIGVSNFKPSHLKELLEDAEVVPAVNQIELHPMLAQHETRNFCKENGIWVESWSPIMRGGELLDNPVIKEIADAHGKEPAQAILRWHIQSELIVIPKSVTPSRIKSNMEIFDFELSDEEMKRIDELDAGKRIGPDPDSM